MTLTDLLGVPVSRETVQRLERFVAELTRWQKVTNLIGPGTLDDLWHRHIADCLQLARRVPPEGSLADLGSGAGLPGLVLAAAMPDRPVHLIESDARKAAFLVSTASKMDVTVTVHGRRIEAALPALSGRVGCITARALAPLTRLLDYSQGLLAGGAQAVFPKGRRHEAELTQAHESWRFEAEVHRSVTNPEGRIIQVFRFEGRR